MMIERLESRIAPAGLVSLSLKGGILTITGDGADNKIEIFPLGGGDYGIQGSDGTMLDRGLGDGPEFSVVLSDIPLAGFKVDLGGGNDFMDCIGFRVAGVTSILGGSGNDTLKFDRFIGLGPVTIDGGAGNDTTSFVGLYSQFRSKFTYTDLQGDNSLTFDANTITLSALQYTTGPGADSLTFDTEALRLGNLTADLGEGDGSVTFVGGAHTLKGAASVKFAQQGVSTSSFVVETSSWLLASGLTIAANSGPSALSFNSTNARVGGPLKITTGAGDDSLVIDCGDFSVGGAVTLTLGSGVNGIETDAASLRFGGDLIVNSLGGNDSILLSAGVLTVAKKSVFNLGGGDNLVDIDSAALTLGSVLYTGGAGKDELLIHAPVRAGVVTALFGAGNAFAEFSGSRVELGAISVQGATLAGEELKVKLDAAEAKVKATTTITGGAGLSTVTLGYEFGALTLGGDFNFIGGSGKDLINFIVSEAVTKKIKVDVGAGDSELNIFADQLYSTGVRFRAQAGNDVVTVVGATGLVGLIDVNPGDGDSNLSISGNDDQLRVAGVNYTATGASGAAMLEVKRAFVAGALNLTTGGGEDGVYLNESIFSGPVLLNLGGGSDGIGIDNGDTFGSSQFRGIFSASLGAGDDFIGIGSSTYPGYARFAKLFLLDGGEGSDTAELLQGFGNVFKLEPVLKNMENAV